jgi:hypothetical protein
LQLDPRRSGPQAPDHNYDRECCEDKDRGQHAVQDPGSNAFWLAKDAAPMTRNERVDNLAIRFACLNERGDFLPHLGGDFAAVMQHGL